MRIEKDFEELLELFNKNGVRYCIIGAFAVAFHVRPRYTKDMDILVEPEIENAKRIVKSLNEFGFEGLGLRETDFCKRGRIVQLGYEPVRVDLITSIKGVTFDRIWRNREIGSYGKEKAFFIGLEELIASKKRTKRKIDDADLELLLPKKKKRTRI